MTRPVSEWQWTDDPAIFWLRMEHLPPSRLDLATESLPPAPRPYRHQATITARQLRECVLESKGITWEMTLERNTARAARERKRATVATITERSTAAAERLLGLDHDTRRTA